MVVAPQSEAMMPDIVRKAFEATHVSIKRQTDKIRDVEERQDDLEDHVHEQLNTFRQILKQLANQVDQMQRPESFTRSSDVMKGVDRVDYVESSTFAQDSDASDTLPALRQVVSDNKQQSDEDDSRAYPDHAQDDTEVIEDAELPAAIIDDGVEVHIVEQLLSSAEKLGSPRVVERLYAHYREAGTPIAGVPEIGGRAIDLFKLYCLVLHRGGARTVIHRALWRPLAADLGLSPANHEGLSTPQQLEAVYMEFLYPYEMAERTKLAEQSGSASSAAMTPSASQSSVDSQTSIKSDGSASKRVSFSLISDNETQQRPKSITADRVDGASKRASAKATDIYSNMAALDGPVRQISPARDLSTGVRQPRTKSAASESASPEDRARPALPVKRPGVDRAVQTDESRLTQAPVSTTSLTTDASLRSRESNIILVETALFERENRLEVEKAAMRIQAARLEKLALQLREGQKVIDQVTAVQREHEHALQEREEKLKRKEAEIAQREGILSVQARGRTAQEQAARTWRQEQDLKAQKRNVELRAVNLERAEEEWCQKTGKPFVPQTY